MLRSRRPKQIGHCEIGDRVSFPDGMPLGMFVVRAFVCDHVDVERFWDLFPESFSVPRKRKVIVWEHLLKGDER